MSTIGKGRPLTQPAPFDLEAGENEIVSGLNQQSDSVKYYIYGIIFCTLCLFIFYILLILQILGIL